MGNFLPFKIFKIRPGSEFLINETLILSPFIAYPLYTPLDIDKSTGEIMTEFCEVFILSKTTDCDAICDLLSVIAAVRLRDPWP